MRNHFSICQDLVKRQVLIFHVIAFTEFSSNLREKLLLCQAQNLHENLRLREKI